jgi:tetratricopeptide (TPR) repeat protein
MKSCIICVLLLQPILRAATYIGPQPCELCHKDIAASQERTAMANTWQVLATTWLPPLFSASIADDLTYRIQRWDSSFTYSVNLDSGRKLTLPVAVLMGGRRHGLGFLSAIDNVDGTLLARRTLIQARYAWSQEQNKLLLAPGCVATKPTSLEAALGVVLSPEFESRCLACHGEPNKQGTGTQGGVHCESCHGPGSDHLANPGKGIINPKKLSNDESINVCARCHVGLTKFSDPSPDDLLIANQVRAIKASECYLQSGKAFSCTTCHDPHNDSTDDSKAEAACLGCHSASVVQHASICRVNSRSGCVGCHMPSVDQGPLHLVDHLIRVHPQGVSGPPARSLVPPVNEYLRILATNSETAAANARARIQNGEDFYQVARQVSVDHSAPIGGYLGRKNISDLNPTWKQAAPQLSYGETSNVLPDGSRWILLQRLPRDFRWAAEQLQNQAEASAAAGDVAGAIQKSQQALMIYPHFLRALIFIGSAFTQSGNAQKGREVLGVATRLYPDDAGVEFALAASLSASGKQTEARQAYEKVIALEPDFTAAYLNLGLLSYAAGDYKKAVQQLQQGLQIDPLSAELNYNLSLALSKAGQPAAAAQAMALAQKLR